MSSMSARFYDFLARPLVPWTRWVLAALVVPLALAFLFPLWRISMEAPQYPGGLTLDIYADRMEGGNNGQHLQEINTLNHYIGMRKLDAEAMRDLDWIPFALGALLIFALRVAAIGNVRALVDLVVMTTYVSGFAFARFIYMLYNFGHHLSPEAPVKVPPFMPAVLGSKQIANFTTHSLPQWGSLLLGTFAVGVAVLLLFHLYIGRKQAIAERAREEIASRHSAAHAGVGALLLALGLSLSPSDAWACSTCACGNPALTSMGTEPPLANRVRLATAVRGWQADEAHGARVSELRFDLLASWAPTQRWSLLAIFPIQLREVNDASLARERAAGTGDLELSSRLVLLLDERMKPRWVLAASLGMRFPTAPLIRDQNGVRLSDHAQLGSGGFAALAGLTWGSFFSEQWSLHAALLGEFPFTGRNGDLSPITGRFYAAPQLQPAKWVALRLGAEVRAEAPRLSAGELDSSTSGFAFFLAPELLFRPATPLTLLLGARLPLGTTQAQGRPGITVLGSVVVDV